MVSPEQDGVIGQMNCSFIMELSHLLHVTASDNNAISEYNALGPFLFPRWHLLSENGYKHVNRNKACNLFRLFATLCGKNCQTGNSTLNQGPTHCHGDGRCYVAGRRGLSKWPHQYCGCLSLPDQPLMPIKPSPDFSLYRGHVAAGRSDFLADQVFPGRYLPNRYLPDRQRR
jgi:hypothetical protein